MTTTLLKLLDPATSSFHLSVETASDVISHLGNLLFKAGYVRPSFIEAALAREKELPTGLPLNGAVNAAIPHTDVDHVLKSGLALATLTRPVVFKNMALPDEPVEVQLVLLLALDQPKTQVEMLKEVANLLQQSELVARLMEARDFQDVEKIL